MRIMQVVKELKHGGAETVALRLMEAGEGLETEGVRQAVAAAPGEWSARFPGRHYEIGHTSLKPWVLARAAREIRAAVRDFRPDLVHAHSPGTIVAAALALGAPRKVRLIGTSHGGADAAGLARQGRLYRALRVPIIACGPGVEDGLRAGGCEPLRRINNGIAATERPDERPVDLPAEFGLPAGRPVAVVLGRLEEVKNQRQSLEAAALVPGLSLLICGDGEQRPALEGLAASLGVGDRVCFAGMRPDAPRLLRAADLQLLTSRLEGLPVSLLEGMAEGTPIIATDVLGTGQLVRDGQNGLLVPLDDAPATARGITRLLEDPQLAERLREGGRETAGQYTLSGMTEGYWRLYAELTAETSRTR